MKVVLSQDVPKVGRKYEEKYVADGYALNFLIPRRLAEIATPAVAARAKAAKATLDVEKKVKEALLAENLRALEAVNIEISGKANPKGHLFAGIHKEQLSEELKKQTRLDVPPEFIILEKPLKEVGDFVVEVKAHDKSAKFKVSIKAA